MGRKVSDEAFRAAWLATGGVPHIVAKMLDLTERGVYVRRNFYEKKHGTPLTSAGLAGHAGRGDAGSVPYNYKPRLTMDGFSGRAVIFSDCHFWGGISDTLAYLALLEVIKDLKPKLVIANGDVLDGAKVSRFPPDGWENRPRMADELDEVKARMADIRHAYRGAKHIRVIGNHDARFDRYLAVNAGEFEGIQGFRLRDHLSEWEETVSLFINGHTMIKHRIGQGRHTAYTNTLKAGTSGVTGHTHRLKVEPFGDYRGRRYWGESGTLADPCGPQFAYTEDGPTEACSGFLVCHFDSSGRLWLPSMCEVQHGVAIMNLQVVLREKARKNAAFAA